MTNPKKHQELDAIIKYKMTPDEILAFKLTIIYRETAIKVFPEHYHTKKPKGDPRKTTLFKHCYKLVQETRQILSPKEYQFYVRAQMDIMRSISADDEFPFIDPNCLNGEKAWKRWLKWKSMYNDLKQKKAILASEALKGIDRKNVIAELDKTKKIMEERIGLPLTRDKTIDALNNKAILRWVATHVISPYYALLSPLVNEWLQGQQMNFLDTFYLDPSFYTSEITDEVKQYFYEIFYHEF